MVSGSGHRDVQMAGVRIVSSRRDCSRLEVRWQNRSQRLAYCFHSAGESLGAISAFGLKAWEKRLGSASDELGARIENPVLSIRNVTVKFGS